MDAQFLSNFKYYLVNSTARGAMYAYFNVAPKTVVLINSTTPATKETRVEGDRLMNHAVSDLGVHVVNILHDTFWNDLYTFLHLSETQGIATILLGKLFTFFRKNEDLNVNEIVIHNNIIYCRNKNSKKQLTEDDIVGGIESNFHIARQVVKWYETITHLGTEEHLKEYPHISGIYPTDFVFNSKLYNFPVDFYKFFNDDGSPVFKDVHQFANMMAIDGLTSVSIKSFLKKAPTNGRLVYYQWVINHYAVQMLAMYSDDQVTIKSYRPNVVIIPLPSSIELDTENVN